MHKKWRLVALLMFLLVVFTACRAESSELADPSALEMEAPTESIDSTDPTDSPQENQEQDYAYTAPLTGMKVEEPAEKRPVAVMINNAPAARPQSGLSHADQIYEVLAEGGITRLIAIFQSEGTTETVGPIRSIRPYLIEIGESYGSILAHAGGSQAAYSILQKQGKPYLDEISNAGPYYFRSSDRKAPHNLYSSLDQLREAAAKRGYSEENKSPVYNYLEEGAQVEGEEALHFDITYLTSSYEVSYDYDESTSTYIRSVEGKEDIDADNGERLAASNIIVLSTAHKVLDDVGRLSVDLTSGGDAMLFQQGKVIHAKWSKKAGDLIRLTKEGKELPLVPGKTFLSIVTNVPPLDEHVLIRTP
ncbi:putative lipoprotein YerB [Paenibacillus sp. J45TS6]|uniref:DUF3048 domain-containing protein n=1 Tax=unclassified Paenibacillus TaxID=185978 RepID=UPI001AFD69E6|nr:DUF3048 domain-containing protein [Paenibacillus sp. J45TS6]GIP45691.1 putative lipoprotein YerB [Paenibacillus sp. J45TS6]